MKVVSNGLLRTHAVQYLLRDDFSVDASAPLTTPRTCDPGPGTLNITDVENKISISGGKLVVAAQATPSRTEENILTPSVFTRATGLALLFELTHSTNNINGNIVGWFSALGAQVHSLRNNSGTTLEIISASNVYGVTTSLVLGTDYYYAIVLHSTGAYYFIKGGVFASWSLVWIDYASSANLYTGFAGYNDNSSLDYFRVRQLPNPFANDAITVLNQATPSGSYTGSADAIYDFVVTAPGALAGSVHMKYRYQDANNYWDLYFDSAGALKLDSVLAGVATNRINVAGVASAGNTYTIRVIVRGSLHDVYSAVGSLPTTVMTKRGAQINISHMNTQTGVNVSATSYTAGQILCRPYQSSMYLEFDR